MLGPLHHIGIDFPGGNGLPSFWDSIKTDDDDLTLLVRLFDRRQGPQGRVVVDTEDGVELGMGLEDRLGTQVMKLSGGQRQAISLLMATVAEPRLLLLDEHTAALDPKVAAKIMEITGKIVEERDLTTLMVTHNMEMALRWGDRLIMMHLGKIILDVRGAAKKKLTVNGLVRKFHEVSGDTLAIDTMLLE